MKKCNFREVYEHFVRPTSNTDFFHSAVSRAGTSSPSSLKRCQSRHPAGRDTNLNWFFARIPFVAEDRRRRGAAAAALRGRLRALGTERGRFQASRPTGRSRGAERQKSATLSTYRFRDVARTRNRERCLRCNRTTRMQCAPVERPLRTALSLATDVSLVSAATRAAPFHVCVRASCLGAIDGQAQAVLGARTPYLTRGGHVRPHRERLPGTSSLPLGPGGKFCGALRSAARLARAPPMPPRQDRPGSPGAQSSRATSQAGDEPG